MSIIRKPEHKKLEAFWYKKLEEEGFVDIEDTTQEHRPLKSWHNLKFKNKSELRIDNTIIYTNKCLHLLRTFTFPNENERKIWELHSEGFSVREIALKIQIYERESVRLIINKLKVFLK